jgi:hypothetical protein
MGYEQRIIIQFFQQEEAHGNKNSEEGGRSEGRSEWGRWFTTVG